MNSRITYLYRDASNYKFWGSFVVSGMIHFHDIKPYLFDREYFIPDKVGLDSLAPERKNEDDHDLHEFHLIERIEDNDTDISATEFLNRLAAAHAIGWFGENG